MKNFIRNIASYSLLILTLFSCSYSFTGSSIPKHIKNIYIDTFRDKTHTAEADISEKLTNMILDNFISDNSLTIVNNKKADSELSGSIISIVDKTGIITGEEITQRKIVVKVKATYRDNVKNKKVFQKVFQSFSYYDNNASDIYEARSEAINDCLQNIAEDILMAVVARW